MTARDVISRNIEPGSPRDIEWRRALARARVRYDRLVKRSKKRTAMCCTCSLPIDGSAYRRRTKSRKRR